MICSIMCVYIHIYIYIYIYIFPRAPTERPARRDLAFDAGRAGSAGRGRSSGGS